MLLGFYCPNGSVSETEVECPIGAFCPPGSPTYRICTDGTYAPNAGQDSCDVCPAGRYCVAANVVVNDPSTLHQPCPEGYYCPNGTGKFSLEYCSILNDFKSFVLT